MSKRNEKRLLMMVDMWRTARELGNSECKTIGNLHPSDKHCVTCSFQAIEKYICEHINFWAIDNRYERAPS